MSPFEILRRGHPLSDDAFDALYPPWVRELSTTFWTPVEVAVRAGQLLAPTPGRRVLDVGSGVGKFCHIAATTTNASFHGIEQRPELVEVARDLLVEGEARIRFVCGNMLDLDWTEYQGIYLYNPFFEHTSGPWCQIDRNISYSRQTQEHYIRETVARLEGAAPGTRVATFYGFGGTLPASFRKIAYELFDRGPLEVWVKGS